MNFERIDELVSLAKSDIPPDHLLARQIQSSSIPNPYFNFMRRLAMEVREPGVFLEIGSYMGAVGAHVVDAKGWHSHVFVSVDINHVNFSDPSFIFLEGDSTTDRIYSSVKSIAEKCGGIFAVFQDSSHHYYPSVKEWELYSPLVRPGGIWMADDITPAFKIPEEPKGMVEYFDELPGEKKIYDDLHIGSRIGMVLL